MATDVKTTIDLPEVAEYRTLAKSIEKPQLLISTGKSTRSGIDVQARVQGYDGTFVTITSSDFRVTLRNFEAKRVTQKRLDEIHAEVVTDELIEEVKVQALEYYRAEHAKKVARGW